jgi:biopolymer transport protein TolR
MTTVQTMAHRASRRRARPKAMSEINVTPFVDVMLVLLIVFMVTAPLLTVGIAVDLPQTRARALGQDQEPLSVSIDSRGQVFLQNTAISEEELVPKLVAIAKNGYEQRIYVRADKAVPYGTVARVMGLISEAGFTRMGLVNDSERRPPANGRPERERE